MRIRVGLTSLAALSLAFGMREARSGDPAENTSRLLGGAAGDACSACAVDADGNTYVVGTTTSAGFDGAAGTSGETAFLSKIGPDGATLWTRRHPAGVSRGRCVAVAPDGSVRLGGEKTGTFDSSRQTGTGGSYDGFVATYDPNGVLLFVDVYGGPGEDSIDGVSVGPDGRTHLTGKSGAGFPTLSPVLVPGAAAGFDAWYARIGPTGAIETVTLLPGTGDDRGRAVASGADGLTAIGGISSSPNFLGSGGAGAGGGNNMDAFVALFQRSADGSTALRWARMIGGNGFEYVHSVAMDGDTVLAAGSSDTSGIASEGAFQRGNAGGDAFAARYDATGSRQWLTFLGGSGMDEARSVGTLAGDVVLAGVTWPGAFANEFPVTVGAFQTARGGGADGFLARLSADGAALLGSTLLGGASDDFVSGLARAGADSITLVGETASSNFFRQGGGDATFDGATDGFVSRICPLRGVGAAAGLTAAAVAVPGGPRDVVLGWTPSLGAVQQVVRRRSFDDGIAPIRTLATLGAAVTTYRDIAPDRLNGEYWVETIDGTGRSAWSAGARAANGQGGEGTVPEAPDMLTLAASGLDVTLGWRDRSDDEERFEIDRSVDGGPFAPFATARRNAATFTGPHGGAIGSVLSFQVRAVNGAGSSAPSDPAAFRVSESYGLVATRGYADNASPDGRLRASGRFRFAPERGFDPAREPLTIRFASTVFPAEETRITIPDGDLGWSAAGRRRVWDSSRSALAGRPRGRIVLDSRSGRFLVDLRGVDTPDFTTTGYPLVQAVLEMLLGDDFAMSTDLWRFGGVGRRAVRLR